MNSSFTPGPSDEVDSKVAGVGRTFSRSWYSRKKSDLNYEEPKRQLLFSFIICYRWQEDLNFRKNVSIKVK